MQSKMFNKSLGVIVIGDEVLRGDVVDTNFAYVAKQAPSCGLRLTKVSVIPDVVKVIASEVQKFSKDFDIVVTSGGIGTTHDDRTFEAVAAAFDEKLELHPSLLACMASLYNCKPNDFLPDDSRLRLARVPTSSHLIFGQTHPKNEIDSSPLYPVLSIRNVFVLPGVPLFFQRGFNIIKPHICDPSVQFFRKSLYFILPEPVLAKRLGHFAEKHKHNLIIGSYPVQNNRYYKVRISLESREKSVIDVASKALENLLANELIEFEPDPVLNAVSCVYKMSEEDSDFGRKLKKSVGIVEKALKSYGPNNMILSFNGGKDCTALFHLLFAVMNKTQKNVDNSVSHPRLLYVRSQSPFPEIEQFVQTALHYYRYARCDFVERHVVASGQKRNAADVRDEVINGNGSAPGLVVYEGEIKASLCRLKQDYPEIEAVFMGTRSSDPWAGNISELMPTDPSWPEYMRINPMLDWTYSDVWHFIRGLSLPYCSLYDMGYTSLGSMENTHPNPELRIVDASTGLTSYAPAYCLKNPVSERSGRSSARLQNPSNSISLLSPTQKNK